MDKLINISSWAKNRRPNICEGKVVIDRQLVRSKPDFILTGMNRYGEKMLNLYPDNEVPVCFCASFPSEDILDDYLCGLLTHREILQKASKLFVMDKQKKEELTLYKIKFKDIPEGVFLLDRKLG